MQPCTFLPGLIPATASLSFSTTCQYRCIVGCMRRDNTPEPGQRQSYLDTIQANLSNVVFSKLTLKSQVRVDLKVKGLGCRIVAKSDELLIGR